MNWFVLSLCIIIKLEVVWSYTDAALSDQVTTLPLLQGEIDFNFFSGFIKVSGHKNLHYIYVESQNDPENDPLIYFTSGGPLCSGLVAFFTEFGPWRPVNRSLDISLELNPFSWNKMANLVFVEQPVGVGFSYSSTGQQDGTTLGDHATALDNFRCLMLFLDRFPERKSNKLYLASEAYGGHIVPLLAEIILTSEIYSIVQQLQGIIVANPFVSFGTGIIARAHALWGYQLIPQRKWKSFVSSGCSSLTAAYDTYSVTCWELLEEILTTPGPHLDYGKCVDVYVCWYLILM